MKLKQYENYRFNQTILVEFPYGLKEVYVVSSDRKITFNKVAATLRNTFPEFKLTFVNHAPQFVV